MPGNIIHAHVRKQGIETRRGMHAKARDRKIAEIKRDLETGKVTEFDDLSQEVTCENGNKCIVDSDGKITNIITGEEIEKGKHCCDDNKGGGTRKRKGKKRKRTRKSRKGKKSRRKGKRRRRRTKKH